MPRRRQAQSERVSADGESQPFPGSKRSRLAPRVAETPKYPRPNILLIDLPDGAAETVASAGYRVHAGTFGDPYQVPVADGYQPVVAQASLPDYSEQEIIVVDLRERDPAPEASGTLQHSLGTRGLWASTKYGQIDPRPVVMRQVQNDFDRIYQHGGVIIVFVGPRKPGGYVLARKPQHSSLSIDLYEDALAEYDTWCFLSNLAPNRITVERDSGREITLADEAEGAAAFLQPYIQAARFEATINRGWRIDSQRWLALAHNKFEQPIAAVITPYESDEGLILLLPQVADPGALVVDLLQTFLPAVVPRLFPHVEGAKWVRRPDYELPEVVRLKSEIDAVNQHARQEIARLEEAIKEQRSADGFLHDLLTLTGDDLVAAVRTALERIGFKQIEDVDAAGKDLREDLRVHDRSPLLLIEVKGITGLPAEADALQVTKYLAPRMRELERFDIRGLSVINHQRHLPALDRQNTEPFQRDVLTNAREHGFGLLTTWDLYRLVRNAVVHSWAHEQVAPVLYRDGRIEPVPEHFDLLGHVDGIWTQAHAVGLKITDDRGVSVGDVIAFEGRVEFYLVEVESLQLDGAPTARAESGAHVGVRVPETERLRDGMRVFVVDDRSL